MKSQTFWQSHSWAFSDTGMPDLVTLPEFLRVLREYLEIPVDEVELLTLSRLGAFVPRGFLVEAQVTDQGADAVEAAAVLPVYETIAAARFVKLGRSRFALHIPVVTTTVRDLRTKWGPKLADARAALGLRPGRQPDVPVIDDDPPLAGGRTWHEIARMFTADLPLLKAKAKSSFRRSGAGSHRSQPGPEVTGDGVQSEPGTEDADASLQAFWNSREWTFSDGGEPALLTMTEFACVIHELLDIPVDRGELLGLGNLGVFTPQHMLFVGRLLEEEDRIVELGAPVYEPPSLGAYVEEWRTRFALHVPVATTSVEELRTTWGPKLREARAALGLRQGRQPGRIAAMTQYRSLTGTTWERIAEMDAPNFPPSEYDLMSQASRYRRRARESAKKRLYFKGWLHHEPDSVVGKGISKLRERAQGEVERGRAGFLQGKVAYPEDEDLVHLTVTSGNP